MKISSTSAPRTPARLASIGGLCPRTAPLRPVISVTSSRVCRAMVLVTGAGNADARKLSSS